MAPRGGADSEVRMLMKELSVPSRTRLFSFEKVEFCITNKCYRTFFNKVNYIDSPWIVVLGMSDVTG